MSKFTDMHPRSQTRALKRRRYQRIVFYGMAAFLMIYLSSLVYAFRALVGLETSTDLSTTDSTSSLKHPLPPRRDEAAWILQNWEQHVQTLQEWAQNNNNNNNNNNNEGVFPIKPITAFLEPPLNATVPGTGSRTDNLPPQYYQPLPLRTQSPEDLRKVVYPKVKSCKDIPALLPIDRGRQVDPITGNIIPWNVGEEPTPADYVEKELPFCPVDADPFLPWIHDVFWLGSKIQFIAQNKRRCKTGKEYGPDLERLEPQVALFQSVSVQRILNVERARQLAPELWQKHKRSDRPLLLEEEEEEDKTVRYRLVPYDQADANATRFICKFHTWSPTSTRIELGETLSEYPFNYEMASARKTVHRPGLLSRQGKDNGKFWTSTLLFSCPIPKGINYNDKTSHLQDQSDIPVLYVDIIPIRIPPRFPIMTSNAQDEDSEEDAGYYLHPDWVGPENVGRFDPIQAWGSRHVLPEIEASGRWENIPACPLVDTHITSTTTTVEDIIESGHQQTSNNNNNNNHGKKPHLLSACLWAAASFRTRGEVKELTSDTKTRLKEWIDFHLLVGFDHIYVYDNSAAHTNETDLREITDMYKPAQVTRMEWPFVVCNNNIPAHDNTGERSSQYAAENSCRTRFAHRTEWIASIDTDEYLVPMGEHTSLRTVVENAKDTNILSFRSTRGKLRYTASEPGERNGRQMSKNVTFLEAYNCDSAEAPRPEHADRARKQLYRADFVLNHFVHYSTVTKAYTTTYKEDPKGWTRWIADDTERVVDELNEATMVHTKKVDLGQTMNFQKRCNVDFKRKWLGCYVGFPWPNNQKVDGLNQTDGTQYNCFVNSKVENYWLPRLREVMAQHDVI